MATQPLDALYHAPSTLCDAPTGEVEEAPRLVGPRQAEGRKVGQWGQ